MYKTHLNKILVMCKTKKDVVKTGQKFKTNHFFHSTHNGINIKIQLEEYLWTHLSTYSFLNKLLIRWIVAPYILDQKCISMFFKKKIYHCGQVELHTGVEKHEYIWYWYFVIIPTFFAYTPCTVGYLWDHTHTDKNNTCMHAWMHTLSSWGQNATKSSNFPFGIWYEMIPPWLHCLMQWVVSICCFRYFLPLLTETAMCTGMLHP